MLVSLEDAKLFLRIDSNLEDSVITGFLNAAEDIVAGILRFPLSELAPVPESVKQAVLYITASLYEGRENVSIREVLDTAVNLVRPYRKEAF